MSSIRDEAALSRGKLLRQWLLDIAVEVDRPLSLIFPKPYGLSLNARILHGGTPQEYAETFQKMFADGLIRFQNSTRGDTEKSWLKEEQVQDLLGRWVDDSREKPERDEGPGRRRRWTVEEGPRLAEESRQKYLERIRELKERRLYVSYGLTPAGGAAWELLAEPQWSRFYEESSQPLRGPGELLTESGDWEMEMISPDQNLLMARIGWLRDLDDGEVRIEPMKMEVCEDYPVWGWKRLPMVWRARFTLQHAQKSWPVGQTPLWFSEWMRRQQKWYRRPWELAGWQDENDEGLRRGDQVK